MKTRFLITDLSNGKTSKASAPVLNRGISTDKILKTWARQDAINAAVRRLGLNGRACASEPCEKVNVYSNTGDFLGQVSITGLN